MDEPKTKVFFDITWIASEYMANLQVLGYNKPFNMPELYDKIIEWTDEFCKLDLDSEEYPANDYDYRVTEFSETKVREYLLPSLEDVKMWANCLGYKVVKDTKSIYKNMGCGNELGRLVLLAKGDDRTLRQYAKDCGSDAAILSKIISGKYIPKNLKIYEKLTSKSAQPRNGITFDILWNTSIEIQKELLSDKVE